MKQSRQTKRTLVLSVLSVVLCLAMLIGTTFAWFTDTASASVQDVKTGTLLVDLEYKNSNGDWESANGKTLNFLKAEGAPTDEAILWEPGCTFELPELRVVNNGTLALKYQLTITGIDGNAKLNEVIDWTINDTDIALTEEYLAAKEEGKSFTLKGHMQETAGNEYQDLTITGITIAVSATQDTVEFDSNSNQYDKDAPLDFIPVSSADELKAAFANVEAGEDVNVSLTADVTISDKAFSALNGGTEVGDITIQGNGHTLTNNNADSVRGLQIANSTATRTVTISDTNLKLTGTGTGYNAKENRGVQLYGLENATINLVNCNIDMTATDYSYAVKVINSKNLTINITGCTLTGANCIETNGATSCTFNITDCVFNSNYAPNASYCGNGIQDKNGTNNTYNIKGTTFNGTNAQAWETSATTTINDLGGNVNNTTRTTE